MRKVILLTAMPKEGVWSSSIYVNGGDKLLSSKISFSRILLLFVCCIFCNNVFADDDWRLVQNFESLASNKVKACTTNGNSVESTDGTATIENVTGYGKVGQLNKINNNHGTYGIVFPVSLGCSNYLSKYRKLRIDFYYGTNIPYKQLDVLMAVQGLGRPWRLIYHLLTLRGKIIPI